MESSKVEDSLHHCLAYCWEQSILEKCQCKHAMVLQEDNNNNNNNKDKINNNNNNNNNNNKNNNNNNKNKNNNSYSDCFSLKQPQSKLSETSKCFLANYDGTLKGSTKQCNHRCESVEYTTEATTS